MTKTKEADLVRFQQLGVKILADAIAWHEANNSIKNERDRECFAAGFREAWLRATGTVKVHKLKIG